MNKKLKLKIHESLSAVIPITLIVLALGMTVVPMELSTLMLFLVLFVAGVLPADIIEKAGLSAASSWSVPMLLFAMGSMINLRQFMDEWRTVVTCWFGMLAVIIGVSLTIPIIGKEMALSVAHRGYVLETGKIVTTGSGEELLEDEAVKKAYLGG